MEKNVIEVWTREEYRAGVSPEAAARQLCRILGCCDEAPTLKRMLEDMLASANDQAADRAAILRAFDEAAPKEAAEARRESFKRNNA